MSLAWSTNTRLGECQWQTLAYYDAASINSVKSFITVQALSVCPWQAFSAFQYLKVTLEER